MTVSRAFRADASVNAETRARILKIADRLGYVVDSTASTLRSQRTGFVAVTLPSLDNANFAATFGALSATLEQHGLQVLLGHTNYSVEEEEKLIEQLLRRKPEAMVITGGRHTPAARARLQNADIPVVECWDLPADPIDRVVGFSNADAMAPLVGHLLAGGHDRIGFIAGDLARDSRGADRKAGVEARLQAHGQALTRVVTTTDGPGTMRDGAVAMADMLVRFPDTRAVICVSDLVAFGALSECQRQGIRVPDDIAIGGFGNYEISDVCVPRLTTVDARSAEIGQRAAAALIEVLGTPGSATRKVVKLQPELIIRGST